jgi:predicted metal-dependent hydrolase
MGDLQSKSRRILFNLELAKKPEHCLDYIIAHEMTHLLEKTHNDRFKFYMDKFMPRWRQHKEELSRSVLSYEKWGF